MRVFTSQILYLVCEFCKIQARTNRSMNVIDTILWTILLTSFPEVVLDHDSTDHEDIADASYGWQGGQQQ